ncbi:MAG: tyrosine-type recombinase/integrase [Bacteroidetes bacterium]|nr:tyrosine-type recombinase/integrase [Bacteroidota bacterium]
MGSSDTAFRRGLENDKAEVKISSVNTPGEHFSKVEQRIGVSFRYNKEYITELKKIPGHRWHPNEKQWSFPIGKETLEKILKIFENQKLNIDPKLTALITPNEKKSDREVKQLDEAVNNDLRELKQLMRLKNYSNKTIKSYSSCIGAFFKFYHDDNPKKLSADKIKSYLLYLIEQKNCTFGTINQYINAFRFLYVEVYKVPFVIGEIPRPRKETKLPDVFNDEEVIGLFESVKNLKHRVMLMITYASGLRVSELVNLRIEDIDVRRRSIHIRAAKGKKDRCIPLAETIIKPLHIYWQAYNLGVKGWLFPGSKPGYHLSIRSIQAVFERAVQSAGIAKPVSMHTLRHSYATHSAEHGYDIRHLQKVLGHKSIKTTEIYTHISNVEIAKVKSPLDFLLKNWILDENSKEIKLLKTQNHNK